jgi:uncharacterized protein
MSTHPRTALARSRVSPPPPDTSDIPALAGFPQLSNSHNARSMIGHETLQIHPMTPARINSHVLRTLRALEPELRAAGVRHISVFGSVARGDDTATSDVDLALDLAPDRTPPGFQFVVYIDRLKQRLAAALSRDVDIVVLPARRLELRETLSREAIAAF